MQFHDVLYGRRSVRAFTKEPVDQETLISLIGSATQAPSAMNAQPWSFTVVRNASLLNRISAQAKSHLLKNAAPGLQAGIFRDQLSDPNFHIFYHAPVLIVIAAVEAGPWGTVDCALAAQNLMLAAESLGLGSC